MLRFTSPFPDPRTADPTGLVAVTDVLDVDLLLAAYQRGIFPWSEHPVRWYSPDPRALFLRPLLQLPRRVERFMRKERLSVTLDTAFAEVMQGCAAAHAKEGAWITSGFIEAYGTLHERGCAHSVEVWQEGELAGGLYGVQLGGLFAGESMFHRVPNASKVAFAHLVAQLDEIGTVLFDCQVINDYTAHLGAVCVRREDYLRALPIALNAETRYSSQKWPRDPPPPARRMSDRDWLLAAESSTGGREENA